MIGLIGLRARGDRNSERVEVIAIGRFEIGKRRIVRSGEWQSSCYRYKLVLSPRVGMVIKTFPEWRQATFDLSCVSKTSMMHIVNDIP
jgi:hypothetical protein